jgi:hypothetical protein
MVARNDDDSGVIAIKETIRKRIQQLQCNVVLFFHDLCMMWLKERSALDDVPAHNDGVRAVERRDLCLRAREI